ncbi:MAG: hypothetical protein ICCCNLDF_02099 [Planctomycetes bacterium]|nr:hypothetical protein [Planctomycetota bacterium]
MKVAVSIPDELFKQAERLAKKLKKSRSKLYAMAVAEYLARQREAEITESVNRALAEVDNQADPFVEAAVDEVMRNLEW